MAPLYLNSRNVKRLGLLMLIIILIILSVISIVHATYNHPSADDFCFGQLARDSGFWNAQIIWYDGWDGRYLSTALLTILSPASGLLISKVTPPVLLIALFLSLLLVFSEVFKKKLFAIETVYISIVFFIAYFLTMPSIAEGFYWLPGAITYTLNGILFICFLSLLMRYIYLKQISIFLITAITFLIIGGNETGMFLLDVTILYLFVSAFMRERKINHHLVILLLVAIIASLLVVLAPGNFVRYSMVSAPPLSRPLLLLALMQYIVDVALKLITHPAFIVLTLTVAAFYSRSSLLKMPTVNPFLSTILSISVLFLGNVPFTLTTGSFLSYRVLNETTLLFLIGWIFNVGLLLKWSLQQADGGLVVLSTAWQNRLVSARKLLFLIVPMAITAYVFLTVNPIKRGADDLMSGEVISFNIEMIRRHKIISETESPCFIDRLKHKPLYLYFRAIDGKTHCQEDYYGKQIRYSERLN